jgi:uncharacterized protein (TIGR02594 family)
MTVEQPPRQEPPRPDPGPEWLQIAMREIGTREILGLGMNPRIAEYYTSTDLGKVNDDAVPWCSAFANWCMREAGIKGSGKANARSWVYWGVPLLEPKLGCVVVFERPPNPASGHVAFYCGRVSKKTGDDLLVLGGNQGNQVRVAPYAAARVLKGGYRWPSPKNYMQKQPAAPPPLGTQKK